MKSRIICVVLITAFIIFVCSFSLVYTEMVADEVTQMTERIYEGGEDIIAEIDELDKKWEEYSEFAALYIAHNEIEEATTLISGLRESCTDSEILFRINCAELKLAVEHINESQKPKLNNIF